MEQRLSKGNLNTVAAFDKGYRIVDGKIYSPFSNSYRPANLDSSGYERFTVRDAENKNISVRVHKLAAYQKFGDDIFEDGIQIRHLDGNPCNNTLNNLELGTQSQNMMDKTEQDRIKAAVNASEKIRKFSDEEMEEIRQFHNGSYKETMEHFRISSKGTLHYILNTEYKTSL